MSIWKRGKDNLRNGGILGAVAGVLVYFGQDVVSFLQENIADKYMYLGEWSIFVYIVGGLTLLGYMLDRY